MMRTPRRLAAFALLAILFATPVARAQTPADDVVRCDAPMRAEIVDSVSAALIQTYIQAARRYFEWRKYRFSSVFLRF